MSAFILVEALFLFLLFFSVAFNFALLLVPQEVDQRKYEF
jgi:hypothetical protein